MGGEEQGLTKTDPVEPQVPEVVPKPKDELAQAIADTADLSYLMKHAEFQHLQRVAKMFADSQIVPERYRGNVADCAILLAMAWRHRADPMGFFNGVYIVKGRPGMEAKLAIALVNAKGVFTGPIQYKFTGEGMARSCTAFAIHAKSGEVCEATVDMAMAKAEGWTNNAKWTSMPDVMLRYRSAIFLIRFYCPEVMFGMESADEVQEIQAVATNIEVLDAQREKIRQKVAGLAPALPGPAADAEETPLTQTIAEAPKVEDAPPPAEPPPKPQQTPEERKAERQQVVALYTDLCQEAGEEKQAITKLSTPKLKAECERLSKKLEAQ